MKSNDAYASPPGSGPPQRRWGEFVDAAFAAELEMVTYGERPPLLHELRAGLEQAAQEAGASTEVGMWFLDRRDALPGTDLPTTRDTCRFEASARLLRRLVSLQPFVLGRPRQRCLVRCRTRFEGRS